MMQQENFPEEGVREITEDAFMKVSVGRAYIPEYMSKWGALVIIGNDNKFYINNKGRCGVAAQKSDVIDFLIKVTGKSVAKAQEPILNDIEEWPVDSIYFKVQDYLSKLGINSTYVNDTIINRLDEIYSNKENRIKDLSPLYYTVGEYFKCSMGDKFEWRNKINPADGKGLPILISPNTKEKINIEKSLKTTLNDQRFDTPIRDAINLIFRLM